MKPSLKFLAEHSLTFSAIGLGLGLSFFCGWYFGHQTDSDRSILSAESRSRQESSLPNGKERREQGQAETVPGKRERRASLSKDESKQFAESVRSIFRENAKLKRLARFEKLVEKTGIEHLPELVSLIRENDLRGNDSGDEWTRLWTSWGERDPKAAMDFFMKYDWTGWNSSARGEARNRTLVSWAQADPETARRFVEADGDFVNGDRSMVYGLVEGWANVNPENAADWVFKSGLGMAGEYGKIVEALSRKGGQEGLDAWFSKLDSNKVPDKDRAGFAEAIAHMKQQYEPDKAAAWVESHLGEPWVEASEIVGTTTRAFAERDPKSAIEWASRTGLEQATRIAVETWCERDSDAAGKWMKEHAHIPAFSQSASQVMAYLQQKDPVAAQNWANGITNKAVRDRLLAR
jgi:hypothetical protein